MPDCKQGISATVFVLLHVIFSQSFVFPNYHSVKDVTMPNELCTPRTFRYIVVLLGLRRLSHPLALNWVLIFFCGREPHDVVAVVTVFALLHVTLDLTMRGRVMCVCIMYCCAGV